MNHKILYLSDTYAQDVQGTKISIFNEMKKRGFDITFKNIHSSGQNKINGKDLLDTLHKEKYTDLWLAHTWCMYTGCTLQDINKLGVNVLGFGFSDPYAWDGSKLKMYNTYSTNHLGTFRRFRNRFSMLYVPTACDVVYHKDLGVERTTDILIYGRGIHVRFKPNTYRLIIVKKLLEEFKNYNIKIFGTKWEKIPHKSTIGGSDFLMEINKAKISVDLQQGWAPLAHRMFECMACGTPVITRRRTEVRKLLPTDNEILVYTDYKSLAIKINEILKNDTLRDRLRRSMKINTRKKHNISNRIDRLLKIIKMR